MNGSTMGTGAAGGPVRHVPVLLSEIIDALEPRENGIYIDGTFGAGGTSRALLESAECIVLAIDKDPDAIAGGGELKRDSADRLTLVQGAFSEMEEIAPLHGIKQEYQPESNTNILSPFAIPFWAGNATSGVWVVIVTNDQGNSAMSYFEVVP